MASNKNFQLAFEIGGKVAASLPKSFNVAHQAVAKLNSELTDLRKDQGEVQKLQAMKARVGQTALEYHKAAARVEELQRQISNTENPTRAMIREFERAKTQSSNLRTSLRSQRDELASLKNAYGGADTSAKGLTAREKELKLSIDRNREAQSRSVEQVIRYKTALAQARTNILDAKRAQDELNRSLEKRRELKMEQLGEAKGQLVRSGVQTTAVAAGVFAAANNTANFNRENKMIGLTADMKPAEVQAMGQAMLVTGAATNQFASDIQAAQGFLVAAGQDYKEAQANLLTIGRTATATGSDILDVSKASFTLSDALKIDPSQMKTAMGILVQAGKEGNFEFKDMAKNLPVLGAQFLALKMGGNEAAATMGAALQIARKGASTSDEAANNMNNFMAKILSPETLKKAQKNFGVDMYKIVTSAQKKGQNPFEAAMKSVIKMTKNGDQKLLGELFGDMQVQNFVRPMIQNWEEYRRIKETSLGAGGAVVERDFANITKDNAERLKQLRIQASNAALSFGQALQPALNAALGVLVPLLTKVSEFVANNPNLVSQIVLTSGALLAMRTAVIACRVAMLALSVATKMTPFGWIQLAISALVAAGVLLYQNWDKIKACAVKVWPTIREYGVKALEGLKFVFMNFTPVGWLVQAFKAGADILNTINWSDSGAKIIETLITGIKSKASALVDEVKGVFATVREYLPFSDAKRGPFSQLTKSGGAIMATLASGVNGSNSLQTAISGKFGQTRFSPHGISVAGGLSSRSGASGGAVIPPGGITYAPVINLPPGSPKETEAAVQRALDAGYSDFEKKMSAHLFQSRRLSFG
ncbi:TPA: phage tail tape measure protein [Salmonella enterica subsp. enterica serovar Enteritidis]|uniref:phage tail tape measure protein n=1 Tax=Salmonella TaxID=590 RepID=UPI0004F651A8|nr:MULTISPECIES: phage tail tape measure protein [Salmonella]HDW4217940.1 phage tail tape measure protein [Salmonella enterica subsp. enterica serovar Typhi]AIM75193.1 tail tape measure protein [Salmonella enterica subsp. enterica serovar Enteritidis]ATT06871.1 phage tail tape measure protein [Salmonella enterica subsp. enterica serovar Enteritidis]EGU4649621.1 phage tail tape measure protein [Salmonella enterica]EHL2310646.1 phage tail tape measure protein [Salmonella enterica]